MPRFDFAASRVDKDSVPTLATMGFTDTLQRVVSFGGSAIQTVGAHACGDHHQPERMNGPVFVDAEMTTALLDRLTRHCHIVETGNAS